MPKGKKISVQMFGDDGPPFSPDSGVPMERDEFEKEYMKDRVRRDGDRSFMPAFKEVQQEHNRSTEDTNASENAKRAAQRGNPVDPL